MDERTSKTRLLAWIRQAGAAETWALTGAVASLVAGIVAGVMAASQQNDIQTAREASIEIARLESELAHRQFQEAARGASSKVAPAGRFESRVAGVERKLDVIEKSLVDSPERALSVPMMRRDLKTLEENYERDVESVRGDVDRLYTILMWLIGIIVTISLTIVTVLLGRNRNKPQ